MGFINQRITGGPQFVGLSYHFVIYSMVKRWPLDHRTFVQFWDCSTLTTRMVWVCNVWSLFEFKPFGPRGSVFFVKHSMFEWSNEGYSMIFTDTSTIHFTIWYYLILFDQAASFFESSADICGHTHSTRLVLRESYCLARKAWCWGASTAVAVPRNIGWTSTVDKNH